MPALTQQTANKYFLMGIYLIIICLPFYFIRFKIYWVPFGLIEGLIYLIFTSWLLRLIRKKNLTKRLSLLFKQYQKIWLPALLILLGAIISTLLSDEIKTSAGILKEWLVAPLLLCLIILDQIRNKKQTYHLILSLFFSGIIASSIALWYYLNGSLTHDNRLSAFYGSPNYLAMFLAPIFILALSLTNFARKKPIYLGCCLLIIVIYLTKSYAGWIALIIAVGLFLLFQKNKKWLLFFLILLSIGIAIQAPTEKFQKLINFSYPSIESRIAIWRSALLIINNHPIEGIGPGMFQEYYLNYQKYFPPYPEWAAPQPHNIFLAFWLQTGILGLIGFIWLLANFFRLKKPPNRRIALAILAAGAVILIHGFFDTPYWKNDLAILFWIIISLNYKVNRLFY